MLKKRMFWVFGISYGLRILLVSSLALVYLSLEGTDRLLLQSATYSFFYELLYFVFNPAFDFVLLLIVLFWPKVKLDIVLKITSILMLIIVVMMVSFGLVTTYYSIFNRPVIYTIFGIYGHKFIAHYLFVGFIILLSVFFSVIVSKYREMYSYTIPLIALIASYVAILYISFLGANVQLFPSLMYPNNTILFGPITGLLISTPLYTIIVILFIRILYPRGNSESVKLKKRVLWIYAVAYLVQALSLVIIGVLAFLTYTYRDLAMYDRRYFYLYYLLQFIFNTGIVFTLVIVGLYWKKVKEDKPLQVASIILGVVMALFLFFGIYTSTTVKQIGFFDVEYNDSLIKVLTNILMPILILGQILFFVYLRKRCKDCYPHQNILFTIAVIYSITTYLRIQTIFGSLTTVIDEYNGASVFRYLLSDIIQNPLYLVFLFLVCNILFTTKQTEKNNLIKRIKQE